MANLQHNLPISPTPLIGRETEFHQIEEQLSREDVRLVALTGPGGSGKTRLALEIAYRSLTFYSDGIFFVDLARITDPSLVMVMIAQTLSINGEMLEDFLREKQLLLLMDNFEHVMGAANDIAALLAICPRLKVLVTSREALRLRAEHEIPVSPLPLPELRDVSPREEIGKSPAVKLFIQRAQAVNSRFELSEQNALVIAGICRRLDGLPLAIELAAARMKLFSPEILLDRLNERLKYLTAGARDLPSRQQTLRATLDWSYQLLGDEEQRFFRRMGVFRDGGTLNMIQVITISTEEENGQLLDFLSGLMDKNMLRRISSVGEEDRFTMLETIHEYAKEKLEASEEGKNVHFRHAEAFLRLAEKLSILTWTSEQAKGLDQLEREYGNIREALQWTLSHDPNGLFLRLAAALWRFWSIRGPLLEGRSWLDKAVAICEKNQDTAEVHILLEVLDGASDIARWQGDSDQALAWMWKALEICRKFGEESKAAEFLRSLAMRYTDQGDYEYGLRLAEEAVALQRKLQEPQGIRLALEALFSALMGGDRQQEARTAIEEASQIARASGSPEATLGCQLGIMYIATRQEQYEEAQLMFEEYLPVARELADQWGTTQGFCAMACLTAAQGRGREAAWFLGAAQQIAKQGGFIIEIPGHKWFQLTFDMVKGQIGESVWTKEYQAGQTSVKGLHTMSEVLDILENYSRQFQDTQKSVDSVKHTKQDLAGMTSREIEVLCLVAQGLSDAEVAERLVLSPRTVNAHLTSVYRKLGVNSRSAATRFAIEHGLA